MKNSELREIKPKSHSKLKPDSILGYLRTYEGLGNLEVTSGKLADLAGVQPSNMSAYQNKNRIMPVSVAVRLARALSGTGHSPDKVVQLAKKLRQLSSEKSDLTDWPDSTTSFSVEDRMVLGIPVRVAFVVSEPFIFPDARSGFAYEVYTLLRDLLGVKDEPQIVTFGDLPDLFQRREVDLVVSAVLHTFRRQRFMEFTTPLPFLSISLAGLVTNGLDLTTEDVLKWNDKAQSFLYKRDNPYQKEGRILLARGEIGDEFCRAFLTEVDVESNSQVERVEHLEPGALCEKMLAMNRPVLLLADRSTCEAIRSLDKSEGKLHPLRSQETGPDQFGVLASYPIAFGLPKGDPEWKLLINQAMEALKNEGICKLVAIYQRYNQGVRGLSLRDFITPLDPLVDPRQYKFFEPLLQELGKVLCSVCKTESCPACHRPLVEKSRSMHTSPQGIKKP